LTSNAKLETCINIGVEWKGGFSPWKATGEVQRGPVTIRGIYGMHFNEHGGMNSTGTWLSGGELVKSTPGVTRTQEAPDQEKKQFQESAQRWVWMKGATESPKTATCKNLSHRSENGKLGGVDESPDLFQRLGSGVPRGIELGGE